MTNRDDRTDTERETMPSENNEDLSAVERIFGVYFSPVAAFRNIAKRPDFLTPLIVLSLIVIALTVVVLPRTMPIIESHTIAQMQETFAQSGTPESEQESAIQVTKSVVRVGSYIGAVIGVPITLAVTWLLTSALIFFIAMFQGLEADFKRLLGVIPWISFVAVLSQIAQTVLTMTREITSFEQIQDMRFMRPYSLVGLVPGSVDLPAWQEFLLAAIDPFFIWSIFVMVLALEAANKCSRSQATVTTIIATIISLATTTAIAVVGAALQPQ